MKLSLIVAVAENGVIGSGGDLPWRLPKDLKAFKRRTIGHTIIMGRKTYDSIGHPLPKRRSIVLTRQENFAIEGVDIARGLEEALEMVAGEEEAFVIGGGEIYRQALPLADRLYLTQVHAEIEGDTTFPEIDPCAWSLLEEEGHPADEKHSHPFTFRTYERQDPKSDSPSN